ncbi:MAG: hypothetical protein ACREPI_04405 [Candidatus Dormibacterales bacterium]
MDEYEKEIQDLVRQVDALVEAEGDPESIRDLRMQLEVLKAIYFQATALLASGQGDPGLRRALALRGYGDWSLGSVYAFVYESSVDLPAGDHHAFVDDIMATDFRSRLAPAGGGPELN